MKIKIIYLQTGIIAFIGICGLIACNSGVSNSNPVKQEQISHEMTSSQKLFDEGNESYKNGNIEEAVDKFVKALETEKSQEKPDSLLLSNIHNIRGEVYLSQGVAILSQSDFAFASEYNPKNESALNNLAIWFSIEQFATPDYDKSLEYFNKALLISPDRKDIALNRAVIKIKSGDGTDGCKDLNQLQSEGYPDAEIAIQRFCNN
jgi:tetratricopeptide (TPR) repeat protein